jgi:hypothetical protein
LSETQFFNTYFGLYAIAVIGIVFITVYYRKRLFRFGEKTQGTILDWEQVNVGNTNVDDVQSISKPVVSFKTKDGEMIMGIPVTGFSDSEEPVNISVTVYYDPSNPKLFAVKF